MVGLIPAVLVFVAFGVLCLFMARRHWRMKRTGEHIRQAFLLAGLGLGSLLGLVFGLAVGLIVEPNNPTGTAFRVGMYVGVFIGLIGYVFGRAVELRYDRRSPDASDYADSAPWLDGTESDDGPRK
jgi:TRAP-type C4-dicarboxylate transport system permease large subunit